MGKRVGVLGVVVVGVLAAVGHASPPETFPVLANFHEFAEMTVGFQAPDKSYRVVRNGDDLPLSLVSRGPVLGEVCGANHTRNYTTVVVETDDLGNQRALFIGGNVPAGESRLGGTVKLPYWPPRARTAGTRLVVVVGLFEMDRFLPRFLPGECTTNNGTRLQPNPKCTPLTELWPNCSPQEYVFDSACLAWTDLPLPGQRSPFSLQSFAKANHLTAVDVLWFTVHADNADNANGGNAAVGSAMVQAQHQATTTALQPALAPAVDEGSQALEQGVAFGAVPAHCSDRPAR